MTNYLKAWLQEIISEENRNYSRQLITHELSIRQQLTAEELKELDNYIHDHNLPKDWYFECYYCNTCYEQDPNYPYHLELINYNKELSDD